MKTLRRSNAFVTGAANGIGLGIAKALAESGVNLVLADLDQPALERAKESLANKGVNVHSLVLDVSDREAVEKAAVEAERLVGPIQILINNAGVSLGPSSVVGVKADQWDWILGVNFFGVVNGVAAFVPRMLTLGGEAHVVNTASIGGLQVHPEIKNGPYSTTKYAVVALSEALALELQSTPIGVSVLCPAVVPTTLYQSGTRRPERFGGPIGPPPEAAVRSRMSATGHQVDADTVGNRVVDAIRKKQLFVFTHPHTRSWLNDRHARLMEGFDQLDDFLRDGGSQC